MSKERAHLNLDDDLDLSGFAPKQEKERERLNPKILESVAEEAGFTSREPKSRRRKRSRSPYQTQLNLKCRAAMKQLFHELGDRLDVHDHTTFERALLALMEKEEYSDLIAQYKDITK